MLRFLINVVVQLVLAALALLLAAWVIDSVTLRVGGFFVAVGVFALAQAIFAPFVFNLARQYASAMLGGIGLVSTFLALWVATLFSGGLSINSVAGWIAAPILVWIITALGTWLIGALFVDKWIEKRKARK